MNEKKKMRLRITLRFCGVPLGLTLRMRLYMCINLELLLLVRLVVANGYAVEFLTALFPGSAWKSDRLLLVLLLLQFTILKVSARCVDI